MADASSLTLQFLHCGAENPNEGGDRNDEMVGALKGDPVPIDWTGKRSGPRDDHRADGRVAHRAVYRAPDRGRRAGRLRAVRPTRRGAGARAATRRAPHEHVAGLNMYDRDGDGWGDTWYAGGEPPVELDRPYRDRGVPPRFKAYDRAFLRWLGGRAGSPTWWPRTTWRRRLGRRPPCALRPRRLRRAQRVHDGAHVRRRRALPRPRRPADLPLRRQLLLAGREAGRPDAPDQAVPQRGPARGAFIGAQYRANDDGTRQGAYTVVAAEAAPWLFERRASHRIDVRREVGGYGIEIDARPRTHRRGRRARADHRSLRAGLSGEMSYYETPAGARVFAGGHARLRRLGHALAGDADAREPVAAHAAGSPRALAACAPSPARRLITARRRVRRARRRPAARRPRRARCREPGAAGP